MSLMPRGIARSYGIDGQPVIFLPDLEITQKSHHHITTTRSEESISHRSKPPWIFVLHMAKGPAVERLDHIPRILRYFHLSGLGYLEKSGSSTATCATPAYLRVVLGRVQCPDERSGSVARPPHSGPQEHKGAVQAQTSSFALESPHPPAPYLVPPSSWPKSQPVLLPAPRPGPLLPPTTRDSLSQAQAQAYLIPSFPSRSHSTNLIQAVVQVFHCSLITSVMPISTAPAVEHPPPALCSCASSPRPGTETCKLNSTPSAYAYGV
ncbi:hypothetical protein GALMADRAFT_145357 [Galerina marginata CBS 339.88]|uniref:Uncharacterized protein n=1 Tax=Galerina marginata (strain CBS 339.88) TaxID=685588 RepID=A0A067SFA7_GALM3|nr:hypothetical protein GALMADRAFT_145357 [Galerina marginata CBS 339.88]